jgi:hypothetical protein
VTRFASTNVAIQYATVEFEDANKENEPEFRSLELQIADSLDEKKCLYVTRRNGKFSCPCSFNVMSGHDCQDIIAVHFFIGKFEFRR